MSGYLVNQKKGNEDEGDDNALVFADEKLTWDDVGQAAKVF